MAPGRFLLRQLLRLCKVYDLEEPDMPLSFLPGILTPELTDLTPELLENRGIHLLMMDFDNTIVPYTRDVPTPEMAAWLAAFRQSGIQPCIVSNSKRQRVVEFSRQYGLDCVTHAKKPFSRGIRECLARYQTAPEHAALVGDQIYTDVLGGNCAGLCSILVRAIDNHNIWLKLRHAAELPFIFIARGRKCDVCKSE